MLEVTIINQVKVVFEGKANSVILPGETSVFEIMPFHKSLLSRLGKGRIEVDGRFFPVSRGAVKVDQNKVTVVMEQQL